MNRIQPRRPSARRAARRPAARTSRSPHRLQRPPRIGAGTVAASSPRAALLLPLVLLALLLAGCAQTSMRGSLNGIAWSMPLDRASVPGGVGTAIDLRVQPGDADRAMLWVDGVGYGEATRGDRVTVDHDGVVRVNGTPRAPAG